VLRRWHPDLISAENAVVWIARRRVDVIHQFSYAEMDIYLYEGGQLTKIGVFNTARDNVFDIELFNR
jgi:hypothetical protein